MKLGLLFWETWSYVQIPLVWWLFRRLARRNVAGDMLAGSLLGLFMEFATEPLWDYHFRITVYRDVPLSVLPAWGVMYAITVFVSEKLYCRTLGRPAVAPGDKRIFLFDLVSGLLVGVPMEWIGLRAGVWTYNYGLLGWDWGFAPLLGMPYESLFGYALMMLTAPTFVRHWEGPFEGRRS